jgi:hypothetical protein
LSLFLPCYRLVCGRSSTSELTSSLSTLSKRVHSIRAATHQPNKLKSIVQRTVLARPGWIQSKKFIYLFFSSQSSATHRRCLNGIYTQIQGVLFFLLSFIIINSSI